MSRHQYPPRALTGDYIRAAIGLAVTLGPLAALDPAPAVAVVLGALAAIFALFALRTAQRHLTVYELTPRGLQAHGPVGKGFAWSEIDRVRLDFFSTRRDSGKGWMQLRLKAGRTQIKIDSTLDDFERVAEAAAKIAAARGITMTETTRGNFRALGIRDDQPEDARP